MIVATYRFSSLDPIPDCPQPLKPCPMHEFAGEQHECAILKRARFEDDGVEGGGGGDTSMTLQSSFYFNSLQAACHFVDSTPTKDIISFYE